MKLILNCPSLEFLEFNHQGFVLRDFLDAISSKSGCLPFYNLKSIFVPVLKPNMDSRSILGEVLNLFPHLEQLRLWTTAIDTKYVYIIPYAIIERKKIFSLHV